VIFPLTYKAKALFTREVNLSAVLDDNIADAAASNRAIGRCDWAIVSIPSGPKPIDPSPMQAGQLKSVFVKSGEFLHSFLFLAQMTAGQHLYYPAGHHCSARRMPVDPTTILLATIG